MSENGKSKKYKYARLIFKSVSIGRVLDKLRQRYKSEQQPEHLVIPYVLTCAAYLESKLNDSLLQFAAQRYGEDVADAFMSLSLPKKLSVLVPVLTEGRYEINTAHPVYQRLASLIRVRNSITHAKSEIEETIANDEDLTTVPVIPSGMTRLPRQFIMEIPDITLGAARTFSPLDYHNALENLEKWFFQRCPDRLSKVPMVVDRSKSKRWQEVSTTFTKFLD
ncbi:MAG: hypothetical protein ABSF48_15480 [Thermodesulfobacteriota bacterium]|jgi:hypothetical protein